MNRGKLYGLGREQFVADINYELHGKSVSEWWGEFILTEYRPLKDDDGYTIELEDGRKGRCFIQKRINRAVTGVPPRYRYYFRGSGLLK
jgi:hypothetical protein